MKLSLVFFNGFLVSLHLLIAGKTADLGEEGLTTCLQLSNLNLVLFDLGLNLVLFPYILVVLVDGFLHGKYLALLPLEFLEESSEGSFLHRLFELVLLLAVLRSGEDWLESWIVSIVVLQKLFLVRGQYVEQKFRIFFLVLGLSTVNLL
jgi:hypothetical protein